MRNRLLPFLLAACLFFIIPLSVTNRGRDLAIHLTSPFIRVLDATRRNVSNIFINLGQIGSLRSERQELQSEVRDLNVQLSKLENVDRENATLRQQLGVTGIVHDTPKLLGRIILQSTNPLDRGFTLDVGSNQGVKVGQPVVSQGYLIGRVITTRGDSSVVRSIVSPKSIVQAWIPSLNQKGIVVGDGNTVTLTEIDQGVSVANDLNVETSGLASKDTPSLPPGILIGKISSSSSAASDLKQTFRLELGVDQTNLESAFVLLVDSL